MGISLNFAERQPWLSGIFLGFLTYKPQFGILFPLALVASRNWRALCSATATSLALGVGAACAFGYRGWPAFMSSLLGRNSSLSPDGGVELKLQSIYGLLHWAGASAWISWTVHLTVAVVVAAMVGALWAKPIPYSLKAAILSIGAVTVSPYLLAYDLCILSIAVAFLVRDGMSCGFLPGERTGLLICLAGLFPVATPVAPMICAVLFFLIARRIVAWYYEVFTASRDESIGRARSRSGSLE
jgi:arabinofuranan 3-O-arabinosyltransferase